MTKFNKPVPVRAKFGRRKDATKTYEGGLAFKASPKAELTLRALTCLVGEPKFYGTVTEEIQDITTLIDLVAKEDPEYLMKLAAYARNEMYLRSLPVFLLAYSSTCETVKPYVRFWTPFILKRADELCEVIAAFIALNDEIGTEGKGSLPNSLKKGIADSFYNFDEYQFAKYDRDGEVKLKDVMRLTHPKPWDETSEILFKKIINGELAMPETWETRISSMGSTKEAWESIIPKMGYMAKLRNLRNFLKVDVDVESVIQHLTNINAVRNSKQFPFRFYSALKVLENISEGDPFKRNVLIDALSMAMEISVENLPKLKGRTIVATDNSGSMTWKAISKNSTVYPRDIGNMLGAMVFGLCDSGGIASVFATDFKVVPITSKAGIMNNLNRINSVGKKVGGGTETDKVIEYLLGEKIFVDRIFILSDMQCWHGVAPIVEEYRRKINPNVFVYSWDLTGYGTLQFPEGSINVVTLAGWSDKVLNFIDSFETFGDGSMIKAIENYDPLKEEEIWEGDDIDSSL